MNWKAPTSMCFFLLIFFVLLGQQWCLAGRWWRFRWLAVGWDDDDHHFLSLFPIFKLFPKRSNSRRFTRVRRATPWMVVEGGAIKKQWLAAWSQAQTWIKRWLSIFQFLRWSGLWGESRLGEIGKTIRAESGVGKRWGDEREFTA